METFFHHHFPDSNYISLIKAITYFNDIDFTTKVDMANAPLDWEKIKGRILDMVAYPDQKFDTFPE